MTIGSRKLLLKQQAVEFFPTGASSSEEADELAKAVHLLRNANLTFGFSTAQPFPLRSVTLSERPTGKCSSAKSTGQNCLPPPTVTAIQIRHW